MALRLKNVLVKQLKGRQPLGPVFVALLFTARWK